MEIKRLLGKFGLNWTIFYTLLSRGIQIVGGFGTIFFVAKFLSKEAQGFYYTFGSILAIQVFFELGLNGIITQFAAHEYSHLSWSEDGLHIIGKKENISRVSSILHFCLKWFPQLALLLFLVLSGSGYIFFTFFSLNKGEVDWMGAWGILCFSTSINFALNPILAFLEGIGKIKQVAKLKILPQGINLALLLFLLFGGFDLYAGAIATLLSSFILLGGVFFYFGPQLKLLKGQLSEWRISYKKEIFPFQWKLSLSWISGYFILQLFNPVIFATEGAEQAGRMGMTLAVLNAIFSVSVSWITTKIPVFSEKIARQEFNELDKMFFKAFYQGIGVYVLCILSFMILLFILDLSYAGVAGRFLSAYSISLMTVAMMSHFIITCLATYLRCHKKEPLLWVSIITSILVVISIITLGRAFGVKGVVTGYAICMAAICLPWVVSIFIKKKREWHRI